MVSTISISIIIIIITIPENIPMRLCIFSLKSTKRNDDIKIGQLRNSTIMGELS